MRIERTKNAAKGSLWGIIEKIANMLLPFVVRTVLIKKLGIEYLGLSSLFASILQVLSLTELGFGAAAVYAMYKPIAEDNYEVVGGILGYLKRIYACIGWIMLVAGLIVAPFIPYMISGEVPSDVNIFILYFMYLGNTAASYFLWGYKASLLTAMQRNDIISKVGFLINSLTKIMQIVLLFIFPNYYVYTIVIPVTTMLNNLIKSYIVEKKYPKYLIRYPLDKDLKKEIKSKLFPLMSTKLAVILLNAADTLVISSFLGLRDTALYNNYYYIMTSIQSMLFIIYASMQAGVGNSLAVDSKAKFMNIFNKLSFINNWIVTFCTVCLLCLYQPFIRLWLGDNYMLSFGMVVLFCIYFYATTIQRVVVIYKDAAGIWKEDMLRCYLSCTINILVNIITVRYIGLYGVIGSSVFVSVLCDPWIGFILYKTVFKESSKNFYLKQLRGVINTIIIGIFCFLICVFLPEGLIGIVSRGVICCILVNSMLYIFYRKDDEFSEIRKNVLDRI